jgi:hypothetical protein
MIYVFMVQLENYFTVKSMLENLIKNKLITADQRDKIRVHFFSRYTHPTKYNIDMLQGSQTYNESSGLYEELIFLYVARLMYLYLKIYV